MAWGIRSQVFAAGIQLLRFDVGAQENHLF